MRARRGAAGRRRSERGRPRCFTACQPRLRAIARCVSSGTCARAAWRLLAKMEGDVAGRALASGECGGRCIGWPAADAGLAWCYHEQARIAREAGRLAEAISLFETGRCPVPPAGRYPLARLGLRKSGRGLLPNWATWRRRKAVGTECRRLAKAAYLPLRELGFEED